MVGSKLAAWSGTWWTCAGGHDHVAGEPGVLRRGDAVAVGERRHVGHGGPALDGGTERACVSIEVAGHLGGRHEAFGVGTLVSPAGQAGHPVGRQQAKRVPARAAPALRQPSTVEHDVVPAGVGQAAAGRQPGVSGPDDDRVDLSHPVLISARRGRPVVARRPRRLRQSTVTSMAIGTELVMTSYTAERSLERSTSARNFSAGALPLTLKLTRICS